MTPSDIDTKHVWDSLQVTIKVTMGDEVFVPQALPTDATAAFNLAKTAMAGNTLFVRVGASALCGQCMPYVHCPLPPADKHSPPDMLTQPTELVGCCSVAA